MPKVAGRLLVNPLDKDQPIPELDNTSTVAYCKHSANFSTLFDWRISHKFNCTKLLEEQYNYVKALELFYKELNVFSEDNMRKVSGL